VLIIPALAASSLTPTVPCGIDYCMEAYRTALDKSFRYRT
jgi:hypothetical protein